MSDTNVSSRQPSAIDAVAEDYFDAQVALSPLFATYLGIPGSEHLLDDFSIESYRADVALITATVAALDEAAARYSPDAPMDSVDKVTRAALRDELTLRAAMASRVLEGIDPVPLNVLDCAVQSLRDVFDLMATQTEEQWRWVLARLQAVPMALSDYAESLRFSSRAGAVAPRRQVVSVGKQCADQAASTTSTYTAMVEGARGIEADLRAELEKAAAAANAAYGALAEFLADELLDHAPEPDAVGIDRYRLLSRSFLGTDVDLADTYTWGQQELERITEMMRQCAEAIQPGASIAEAVEALDADERYLLDGTAALQEWMQQHADHAIAELADVHFDIPEQVRTIECKIAPSQTGIIYYTGPSEDFSRPGRMWWSVPAGVTRFATWRELTTVYHEGVPGHHLQIAQTTLRGDVLNRWRRLAAWTSGHGEGWALYAEWLMSDLGYLDDPGMRMGLLDAQSLRAARVVIDIGVHCEFEAPAEVGGGAWTYDKAWQFLNSHVNMDEGFVRFELDRYLGYPGQAPSYKIGERFWLELRDDARRKAGDDFDLSAFHRRALDVGGVGLDVLRSAVLEQA
ncbi:MAG: DUF885 domain-containing protein [Ornithinimicrobium sp.]